MTDFFVSLHQNINIPGLEFFNSFTQNPLIAQCVFYLADLPIFVIPLFLAGSWIFFAVKKQNSPKEILLFLFYSMVLAILVSTFIQQFVDLDRPEESIKNAGRLILAHIPDASFPSDHASVGISFITSLFLFWYVRFALILTPFFILMLLSRISGGLHWPLDILVGSIIGVLSAFSIYKWRNLNILKKTNTFLIQIASFLKL